MQRIAVFIYLLISFSSLAQEGNAARDTIDKGYSKYLTGRVISNVDRLPLQSAHIINLNTVEGTITSSDGTFRLAATANDTIFISYIGFQSVKLKITNDLLKGNELEIAIHEKTLNMDEVTVKSHKLIGVLVVDSRNVPEDKYSRIQINGLPQAYEMLNARSNYSAGLNAIFNPVDFWYDKLGSKPKELRRLKKLKEGDQVRTMMEQKYSREVIMDYLDMSRKELNELLSECNYSQSFIERASDLQIIEAFLEFYENHNAIQKGKVKQERIQMRDSVK
ncbi:MAG: carboxypeptidase-like regulatory domain-containing protein [Flavobacteriaceae bacterium]|nr:carboxypeptidase-like regulatory domain-containing protein [Flavobacteriaceae bacterium]